jgi:transposase InsO family protein
VSAQLEKLEQQGIIEAVEGPTPWVSPLVVIPKKNGEIRLCVDMREANKAIHRERHPTPTVDDLIHALNGATVFSKLDLSSGYHQLSLAPESRYITTFATHKGLRRFARLNFGTNSASEVFQKVVSDQIRDVPSAMNVSDDIIIFGSTQEEHDRALEAVFRRFDKMGLTLNKKKCEFNKSSLSFFGFVFSSTGVSPDPAKVRAIHEAQPPASASGVRSFLGMVTYCAKFIPNFSDITMPLRELTKKNNRFVWGDQQQRAFEKIKELLTSNTVMAYFDKNKQTELVTDASPWGLSAILSQHTTGQDDRRIVAFVSRSLSPVEQRYSQREKEAFAIVWAIERLHLYLYGGHFTLLTDCKPVQLILSNAKSKPPARIERWNLRLQEYEFTVVHTKGISNPSDFLSRHPTQDTSRRQESVASRYVNFLSTHAVPKAMSLNEIEVATKEDPTLQKLVECITTNKWDLQACQDERGVSNTELKQFYKVRQELTVNDDVNLLLKGSRIIMPTKLRKRAISIAHEGHQGIVKTKQLLREKIWFPGMDEEVKKMIGECLARQANGPDPHPDPLHMSPLPPEPWYTVHVDFCGPFPTGEYLLVVIDAYSRFPEVDIVSSTSAKSTISKLERIFAVHGIPRKLRSDNGPPFTSHEFKSFVEERGIQHQRTTPLWPQGNSEAERFMKPLTKAIRTAHAEGRDWRKDLFVFLLNYRATPHVTTGVSPSALLFNRVINTKLPQLSSVNKTESDKVIRERDGEAKAKMKLYADKMRKAKSSEIQVGDAVLLKQRKQTKLSCRFDPIPFCVTRIKGTMITVMRNGKFVTRNASLLKKITPSKSYDYDRETDEDVEDEHDCTTPSVSSSDNNLSTPPRRYPTRDRTRVQHYGQNIYDQ